jgi:hypothetical protein
MPKSSNPKKMEKASPFLTEVKQCCLLKISVKLAQNIK